MSGRISWAGYVARIGEVRNTGKTLIGKFEGKSPRGRPRKRREINTRMALRKIVLKYVDWMYAIEGSC